MAGQAAHTELTERAHNSLEAVVVDIETHAATVELETVDTVEVGQGIGRALGLGSDRCAREVPELTECARLLCSTGPDDGHTIAQGLDLAQDVTRQQDRPTLAL